MIELLARRIAEETGGLVAAAGIRPEIELFRSPRLLLALFDVLFAAGEREKRRSIQWCGVRRTRLLLR